MHITLGKWTQNKLDSLLHQSAKIKDTGARIDFLSRHFLNIDYKESTLTGSADIPEVLAVNLSGIDCFTYLDYIESMRLSGSFSEFMENLKNVRYRNGKIAFENRNHFFTDWREFNSEFIDDVTAKTGGRKTKIIAKILNKKADGTFFINGIKPVRREIKYIPSGVIDDAVMDKIKTGDYAGIYSDMQGLDVSHVGIIIKNGNAVNLRHASSEKGKVVEQNFREYIRNKPGMIILRPKFSIEYGGCRC
ncbi:MAG: DUF1460 domain-containing protein [Nitrospirae bacterium]|nr:DUF1460 domain-containing protein [Nitrospirota bacterium]